MLDPPPRRRGPRREARPPPSRGGSTLAAAVANLLPAGANAALSSSSSSTDPPLPPPLPGRSASVLLRRRAREELPRPPNRRAKEDGETNDDGRAVLPVAPLSLELSDLPPGSPLGAIAAAAGGPGRIAYHSTADAEGVDMGDLLDYVSDLGTQAFLESRAVGERFGGWDLGTLWSVAIAAPSPGGGGGGGDPAAPAGAGAKVARSSDPSGPAAPGTTAVLTLGHGGTVTVRGVLWDDDPDPEELMGYVAREMNEDGNKAGLLEKLSPLACDAGGLIGNTCGVRVEVVGGEEAEGGGEEEGEEEGGGKDAQGATAAENDAPESLPWEDAQYAGTWAIPTKNGTNSTIPGDTTGAPPTPPAGGFVDTSTNTLEALPSDSKYSSIIASSQAAPDDQGGNGKETPLQIIIPILIVSLAAFVIAGLILRRKRRKRSAMAGEDALNTTDDEETVPGEPLPSLLSNDAYDAIVGPKDGAENSGGGTSPRSAIQTLDDVLDSFSEAGSSFVSDSTASGTLGDASGATPHGSVLGGLTGILGNSTPGRVSPTPSEDAAFNDRAAAPAAAAPGTRPGADVDDALNATQPASNSAAAARSVQKPEAFEGAYRPRSAMAKLGLRKDILHVSDDTHEAPGNAAGGGGGGGGAGTDPGDAQDQALGKSYGVTRTVSPRKSFDMMERQRSAEGLGRYFGGIAKGIDRSPRTRSAPRKRGKNEGFGKEQGRKEKESAPDTSKEWILPVGFKRSDSVELVSRSSSDIDSEDDVVDAYA